jgi:hypothetical protein
VRYQQQSNLTRQKAAKAAHDDKLQDQKGLEALFFI